jgi:hypothetical protein
VWRVIFVGLALLALTLWAFFIEVYQLHVWLCEILPLFGAGSVLATLGLPRLLERFPDQSLILAGPF